MSKFQKLKNNFISGQFSPGARGRSDVEEYSQGAEKLLDMFVKAVGGVLRRPGSEYMGATSLVADGSSFILPFVLSATEGYIVVIRPVVGLAKNQISIYRQSPLTGKFQQSTLVNWVYGVGNDILANTADPIGVSTTAANALNLIEAPHYSVWGDEMYIVSPTGSWVPIQIKKTGSTYLSTALFEISLMPWRDNSVPQNPASIQFPFKKKNITATTFTPSVVGPGVGTITSTTDIFHSGLIGTPIRLNQGAVSGLALITAITTAKIAVVSIEIAFGVAAATTNWQLSAFHGGGEIDLTPAPNLPVPQNWPRSIAIFEQSLYFGGTESEKDTLFKSLTGNNAVFMAEKLLQDAISDVSGIAFYGEAVETDPTSFRVAAKVANRINWMHGGNVLEVGTAEAEWVCSGGETILSKFSALLKESTSFGSRPVQPVRVDDRTIYVSKDGKSLREFRYADANGSFRSRDLNLLSDELAVGGAVKGFRNIVYLQSRKMVVTLSQGNLHTLTISSTSGALAWAEHSIKREGEEILGVCTMPWSGYEDLFILIGRQRLGSLVTYIERISSQDLISDDLSTAPEYPFMDSYKTVDMSPASTDVTGLEHLASQLVDIYADGLYKGTDTVSADGELTLDSEASKVTVGIHFEPQIDFLEPEMGGDFGPSVGQIKQIDQVVLRLLRSKSFKIGGSKLDAPRKLDGLGSTTFTGDVENHVSIQPNRNNKLSLIQNIPGPLHVLFAKFRGVSYD